MNEMPFDPDFDSSSAKASADRQKSGQSTINLKLKPQTMFIAGIVGGVMALCTIGFVVLLTMFLKGGVNLPGKSGLAAAGAPPAVGVPPSPAPEAAPSGPVPPVTKNDHILGSPNAKVVLIEYSDTECPFCKRFHSTMQRVKQEYGDKVAWVYRHYPLSFHANAAKEDEASECAAELGGNKAFWTYLDKIFERTTSNGTGFALDKLVPLAKEIGLNESAFKKCLDSGKYAQHVQDDLNGGQAAGVQGTPGTFVVGKNGSQLIPGALPYESIKQAIDAAL